MKENPNKKPEIILYGGGGHGKALIDMLNTLGSYNLLGIIDDNLPVNSQIMGVPILGGPDVLPKLFNEGVQFAVNGVGGIGNVDIRIKTFELMEKAGFSFPTLVHPSAWVETSAVLDEGVQVLPLAYVGTEVRVGFGSIINAKACLCHDVQTGRITNFSPNATLAGGVIIEDHVQVGMSATINLNVRVGKRARIGNGATVKADVPPVKRVHAGTIWPLPWGRHPYAKITQDNKPPSG